MPRYPIRWPSLAALALMVGFLASVGLADAADKADAKKPAKADKTVPVALVKAKTAGTKLDTAALARLIDTHVNARLAAEKVTPSPRAEDAEFLRRVYLDIVGHVPAADKAAEFLASTDPAKRAKLIDELLASPEYGRRMADQWTALTLPKNSDNRRLSFDPYTAYLTDHFNKNTPWDKFVTDLLTATGSQEKNAGVLYFVANREIDKITDNVTKVFMGVQLQCAQCHNHPFKEDWKQDHYWETAAFFLKVQTSNPRAAGKNGTPVEVSEAAQAKRGKNALPESAKLLPPKFFLGEVAKVDAKEPYRPVLAAWLTTKDNPFFTKAIVNRLWNQFHGRGLVNPVDDLHELNVPSHPELMADLAEQFAANGFDVKNLIRAICNSETYQRSAKPTAANAEASSAVYSRMAVKVLTPEQLFDSLDQVIGFSKAQGKERAQAQGKNAPAGARAQFVNFFAVEDGSDPTEYQAGIPQVLRLMNSAQLNNANTVTRLVKSGAKPDEAVEQLYLATLSRKPTEAEATRLAKYVEENKTDTRAAYGNILWALINSSEFSLNR